MNTEEKRKALAKWILESDENILNEVETVYNIHNTVISDEHKRILDQRYKDHQENPNTGKNWNKVKSELTSKYGF